MTHHCFTPQNVCSQQIDFDLEAGIIHNVRFTKGCDGNLQGVARLAEGQAAQDVIGVLSGILCRNKGTSCPDQFARALSEALR